MEEQDWLAARFEEHRPRLRAVAYRMLGSVSEADDAVQDAWLRLSRSDADEVENLGGWLTTVVARVCLNMLRSRKTRREEPLGAARARADHRLGRRGRSRARGPAGRLGGPGAARRARHAAPAERLAFVLHDMFAVPFDEIAPIVDRSPDATRQLASRARRRVQGSAPVADADLDQQREVVNAFLAAAREGDFDALVALLDPDIVLRADSGPGLPGATLELRGAAEVASRALTYARLQLLNRPVLVNGMPGMMSYRDGRPFSVGAITVRGGKIVEMDILADPERLALLDLRAIEE